MEITKNQIVDVINLIMTRLDSLENEQKKQKDYIVQIKKRMLEVNSFINDIIDVVEDEKYNDSELVERTIEIYDKMKDKMLEIIDDTELKELDKKELMHQIIGES